MRRFRLPESLRKETGRVFGEKGRRWLRDLPGLFSACVKKWDLAEFRFPGGGGVNFVCFCRSPDFGLTVLKIGVPHPELFSEMTALDLFRGRGMCACHDSDRTLGAMLLERIIPGADLTSVRNRSGRIRIAARVLSDLPVLIRKAEGIPLYSEWISRAFRRARKEDRAGRKMMRYIDRAGDLFRKLMAGKRSLRLLHGDCHHRNILRYGPNGWRIIDPKGVMGPVCLEPARFMENELERTSGPEKTRVLGEMTDVFSRAVGEPREAIAACAFIDMVLSTCWSFEDNAPSGRLSACAERCGLLLRYFLSLRGKG